ncbi:MAG: hypothetical protein A3H42_01180 [Deltaproteobacteria bacterium RIFCSPLOWO2_02_FULL_46_8]|nr:MAG: hypothetical protein A3H42_01180 [Deltaproteobacteria bacterium RIFCSPLOWO2_02_FULL_46_8]
MNKPCLLAFVDDLFFQSRIQGIAGGKRMDFYFATQGEQLSQLAKTLAPSMIIIDLSGLDSEWLFKHISEIRNTRPHLPIIAFIAHVQEAVRERAEKYGCNYIFTKSELLKKLPDRIEKILRGGL